MGTSSLLTYEDQWITTRRFDQGRSSSSDAQCLTLHDVESVNLFQKIVIGDTKWVHHFTPEIKVDSKQ